MAEQENKEVTTEEKGDEGAPHPSPFAETPPPPTKKSRGTANVGGGFMRSPAAMISQLLCVLVILAAIVTLILWLIYRPHRPRFAVEEVGINQFKVSNQGMVVTDMDFTVIVSNPNRRMSLSYDEVVAFIRFGDEPITPVEMVVSHIEQPRRSSIVLTPKLSGNIPLFYPMASDALRQQINYGMVDITLEIQGRLKFSTNIWKSGRYHLRTRCNLILPVQQQQPMNNPVFPLRGRSCSVHF